MTPHPDDIEAAAMAVAPEITEGLGAILRKFCDSRAAVLAREHLHKMPDSDWGTLATMLSEECARAAITAYEASKKAREEKSDDPR